MEQDYNPKHFTNPCPRVGCHKTFDGLHFISVPASLTVAEAPKNGAHHNAIVRYEETGEVWLYSSEGVPVLVKEAE